MADPTSSPGRPCDVDGTCYCPLTGIVEPLSRKYGMQLVSVIGAHESLRFGEIDSQLSTANTTTISKRPSEFQEADLVTRTQYDEIPTRVEYALTDSGDEVRARLEPLLDWVTENTD